MAVTLAQAKLNVQDALQTYIIDEFRKSSFLLDNMIFDDCISPTGGGGTLTYAYTRLISQSTATFRSINSDYTPQEVTKQRYTVDLKVFGGSFAIDRVIAKMGGIENEVQLQATQKVKAVKALFTESVINGDSASNADAFDGLNVMLTGSSTEFNKTTVIDLSTATAIKANADEFLLMLHKSLGQLDGRPTALMGNSDMIAVLEYLAKYQGRYQERQDSFGNYYSTYNGIPLVDLGSKSGSNDPIIPNDPSDGSSLYFARFGLDGFHGISLAGRPPVEINLPKFNDAGTVKKGDVEMIAAVALKSTKSAGVIRKIKVTA